MGKTKIYVGTYTENILFGTGKILAGKGEGIYLLELDQETGSLSHLETFKGIVNPSYLAINKENNCLYAVNELKEFVDTLIVVPNQKLLTLVPKQTPLEVAFRVADEILLHATKGISDVINVPGLINLDFADVKTVMSQMGDALMGSGIATGDTRAQEAAEKAITSPLIEDVSIMGAQGVLINITGGKDLCINDINEATTVVYNAAGSEANIIFGAVIDQSMENELRVTVIATGFNGTLNKKGLCRENSKNIKKGSSNSDHVPLFKKLETEPLEQTLGEIFGNDGGVNFMSNDLNIPTFMRKQMDT